jgi:MoxR-like ATPase
MEQPGLPTLSDLRIAADGLRAELARTIVGQQEVVDQLLLTLLTSSHALLVGVPGLAKTLLISSLAQTLDLSFKRIQFTPDLMPSDITGTEVMSEDPATRSRAFRFLPGPVFANVVLADEINRTPPKTQAALLESMQERKVSVGGVDYPLPVPFLVLATQNPVEQEGTYPLPEAQLDRFLFMIRVEYPTASDETEILRRATGTYSARPAKVLDAAQIVQLQKLVREVLVADHVIEYAQTIVRRTRVNTPDAHDTCKRFLIWGAGPRAGIAMVLAAKARAALAGRAHASCDDIASVAAPAMRHRLILNYTAQSEGITADALIGQVVASVQKSGKSA